MKIEKVRTYFPNFFFEFLTKKAGFQGCKFVKFNAHCLLSKLFLFKPFSGFLNTSDLSQI